MICYKINDKIVQGDAENALYTYRIAANGIFLEAERPELRIREQIGPCEIRGVGEPLKNEIDFRLPRVPAGAMEEFLLIAKDFAKDHLEVCGWFYRHELIHPYYGNWWLKVPDQIQRRAYCQPLPNQRDYDETIIEIHSHHTMPARFSAQDNADETGFRIYAVIGELDQVPKIRTRIGVFGYFLEIASEWVFELPEGLQDAND